MKGGALTGSAFFVRILPLSDAAGVRRFKTTAGRYLKDFFGEIAPSRN